MDCKGVGVTKQERNGLLTLKSRIASPFKVEQFVFGTLTIFRWLRGALGQKRHGDLDRTGLLEFSLQWELIFILCKECFREAAMYFSLILLTTNISIDTIRSVWQNRRCSCIDSFTRGPFCRMPHAIKCVPSRFSRTRSNIFQYIGS